MSLPRYPVYKESGVAWLGSVPDHWTVKRFKWLIERNDGGVWGDDPDGEEDTIVMRSTEQSVDGHWKLDDPALRKLSESERRGATLEVGDLLVTKSSGSALHIGKTTLVDQRVAELRCCFSNFMQRLRLNSGLLPKLAWYVMNNELARRQFDLASNSTTGLANLNGTMISQVLLPVPEEDEQSAIAAFLDRETAKIDALIAEQEKLIALLAEKRQATISHAVTKGINPDAPMKDSGVPWLGDVPAHWEVIPLKYLVVLRSGGTPSKDNLDYWDGDVPWASARDLKVEALRDTSSRISQTALEDGAATLVPAGAVLVVVRGMILARIFPVVQTLAPMAINQDLKAILPQDGLDSGFLAWLLRGSASESLQRLDEAGHGTKALRMDAWTSMELPVPPLAEQKRIASFLAERTQAVDALSSEAVQAISLLQERRSALIAAAVTGQIDVRGAVGAEAA